MYKEFWIYGFAGMGRLIALGGLEVSGLRGGGFPVFLNFVVYGN